MGLSASQTVRENLFPYWVVRKIGHLILYDADFQATIGFKWGTFVETTGTVISDASHYFGGSRSVKMTTSAVVNESSELKMNLWYLLGAGKYSLEHKWAVGDPALVSASTKIHMGIEPRENHATGFYQGRVRYSNNTKEWQYESSTDVYTSFTPPLIIEQPTLDTAVAGAGDKWSWARIVIDTIKKEYVLFETIGLGGYETRDMKGIPLVSRGVATQYNLLFFVLITNGSNASEVLRSTDWCITKVD